MVTDMLLKKFGTKVLFRSSNRGWEYSDDGGKTWYFTFRGELEIRKMHPDLINIHASSVSRERQVSDEQELELFGETIDEPLPDDLVEMLGIN